MTINNNTPHLKSSKNQNRRATMGPKVLGNRSIGSREEDFIFVPIYMSVMAMLVM